MSVIRLMDQLAPASWNVYPHPEVDSLPLPDTSPKVNEVKRLLQLDFSTLNIASVRELKNPFLWSNYALNKQQLSVGNPDKTVVEETFFIAIPRSKVTRVTKCNLDSRYLDQHLRYLWDTDFPQAGKGEIVLYRKVQDVLRNFVCREEMLVIVDALVIKEDPMDTLASLFNKVFSMLDHTYEATKDNPRAVFSSAFVYPKYFVSLY